MSSARTVACLPPYPLSPTSFDACYAGYTDSNVKFADSEVRMASRFVSSNQQEIEKLLEDKVYKTIIGFGFCDIRNNQGLGQCYQPKPKAEADNTYLDLDYSEYHENRIQ